jgi:hypothetical protein
MRNYGEIQFLKIDTRCFDILGEDILVVASIEKETLAAILYECRKSPIFLQLGRLAESIIENRDTICRLST